MKERVKVLVKSRYFRFVVVTCFVMCLLCISASAEDATSSTSQITAAFTTGFQQMVADSFSLISAMVPPAVSIGAVVFLVRKAMSWFKSMAK